MSSALASMAPGAAAGGRIRLIEAGSDHGRPPGRAESGLMAIGDILLSYAKLTTDQNIHSIFTKAVSFQYA